MSDKIMFSRFDGRGNKVTDEVNLIADARGFEGMAGYAWIILAANPHLSNEVICQYLRTCGINGTERTPSWIQRRRWMFRDVDAGNARGPARDRDGNQARALRLMRENPKLSVRRLVYLLKEHGIKRQREWVRKHRVTG